MASTLRIGMLVHHNSWWLGEDLVGLADEALSAFENCEYLTAAGRAGICLEGILKKMLKTWNQPVEPRATFGQLIGVVRKSNQAEEALLDRLQEANSIRIRASHDKPTRLNQVTEGDSLQIINLLALVVDWYGEKYQPERDQGPSADLLAIFLSAGGPHRLEQEQFLQRLSGEMRSLGVELRTLKGDQYSQSRPFDQIAELMASCRAALIIGLERWHAYAIFEREKSERQRIHQDQYIPTAWNQIEGSIASALRLPILILRDQRLYQEGIFETANHRHHIRDYKLALECRGLSADLRGFLAGWVQHIRDLPLLLPSAPLQMKGSS